MKLRASLLLLSLAALSAPGLPVAAQDQVRGEQGEARREAQAGNIMRSGEIEAMILPR